MKEKPRKETHYRQEVSVNPTTEPMRKEECLCLNCGNLKPGQPDNCLMARAFYEICVRENIALMVTRCLSWRQMPKMGVALKEARLEDVMRIVCTFKLNKERVKELQDYCVKYYTESGKRKHFLEGYPDEIVIAEFDGQIIGYLHFYTDCWEGYKKSLVALEINPITQGGAKQEAKKLLEDNFKRSDGW